LCWLISEISLGRSAFITFSFNSQTKKEKIKFVLEEAYSEAHIYRPILLSSLNAISAAIADGSGGIVTDKGHTSKSAKRTVVEFWVKQQQDSSHGRPQQEKKRRKTHHGVKFAAEEEVREFEDDSTQEASESMEISSKLAAVLDERTRAIAACVDECTQPLAAMVDRVLQDIGSVESVIASCGQENAIPDETHKNFSRRAEDLRVQLRALRQNIEADVRETGVKATAEKISNACSEIIDERDALISDIKATIASRSAEVGSHKGIT